MIRISLSLFVLFSSVLSFGQNVYVNLDRRDYKIQEIITVVYEINNIVDSESELSGANFKIISGPFKSNSISSVNGETEYTYSLTFEIQAIAAGSIEIISPIFQINNKKITAETINLTISADKLTAQEIDEIEFAEFKDKLEYSNGTLRYILSEEFGYIEQFNEAGWFFKRRLTKKEIAKLRKK